ncbi:MAG TPA: hypothetical protein PLU76_10195, partial [Treponemataceae bacterium]|nr:hypothetical protein [Treponemataceae bacterium]
MKIPEKYAEELDILRSSHNYRAFSVLAAPLFVLLLHLVYRSGSRRMVFLLCMLFSFAMISLGLT